MEREEEGRSSKIYDRRANGALRSLSLPLPGFSPLLFSFYLILLKDEPLCMSYLYWLQVKEDGIGKVWLWLVKTTQRRGEERDEEKEGDEVVGEIQKKKKGGVPLVRGIEFTTTTIQTEELLGRCLVVALLVIQEEGLHHHHNTKVTLFVQRPDKYHLSSSLPKAQSPPHASFQRSNTTSYHSEGKHQKTIENHLSGPLLSVLTTSMMIVCGPTPLSKYYTERRHKR